MSRQVKALMNATQENPYASPEAVIEKRSDGGALFTPLQVGIGTFMGGPLAAAYYLMSNFDVLNQQKEARYSLLIGILFTMAILGILPILPERFPDYILPISYAFAAAHIVKIKQLSKNKIAKSKKYQFRSNWKAVLVSFLGLIAFIIALIVYVFLLGFLGIMDFDE